jgi:hypothetical protein
MLDNTAYLFAVSTARPLIYSLVGRQRLSVSLRRWESHGNQTTFAQSAPLTYRHGMGVLAHSPSPLTLALQPADGAR